MRPVTSPRVRRPEPRCAFCHAPARMEIADTDMCDVCRAVFLATHDRHLVAGWLRPCQVCGGESRHLIDAGPSGEDETVSLCRSCHRLVAARIQASIFAQQDAHGISQQHEPAEQGT